MEDLLKKLQEIKELVESGRLEQTGALQCEPICSGEIEVYRAPGTEPKDRKFVYLCWQFFKGCKQGPDCVC